MKHVETEAKFLVDTLIMETLLADTNLSKTAQESLASSLIEKTKEYFGNHIDPDDKVGSVLNLLAPGAISMAFSAMGLGWLGMLFGFALRVFNIDVSSILSNLYQKLKSELSSGKKLTSNQVQGMVDESVQNYAGIPESEMVTSSVQYLENAKWIKLALIAYDAEINKIAGPFNFSSKKWSRGGTASILSRVLGWIFKIALASAGLMVAGDVVNKFLGRPNALDNTIQKGHPVPVINQEAAPISSQTKFKINPGYADTKVSGNWIERIPNTRSSIANLIVGFVHQVYDGVKDADVESSNTFNKLVDDIAWYNHASAGDQIVFIPKNFTSKKQLVDHFIDDVAAKSA